MKITATYNKLKLQESRVHYYPEFNAPELLMRFTRIFLSLYWPLVLIITSALSLLLQLTWQLRCEQRRFRS